MYNTVNNVLEIIILRTTQNNAPINFNYYSLQLKVYFMIKTYIYSYYIYDLNKDAYLFKQMSG